MQDLSFGRTSPDQEKDTQLTDSPLMAHLLGALEKGTDIGDFGRLTFAIVARHFIDQDELIQLLAEQPDLGEQVARTLVEQVVENDYSPPTCDQVLVWHGYQDFPLCPDIDYPDSCDVYADLVFPQYIYDRVYHL